MTATAPPICPRLLVGHVLQKAKQAAQEMSQSFSEQIAALLGHLEIPGGSLHLDSQADLSAGIGVLY